MTEYVFNIRDSEHRPGTNRYTFKHNEHWKTLQRKNITFGLRSVVLIPAIRYFSVNFELVGSTTVEVPLSVSLGSNSVMNDFNVSIESSRRLLYEECLFNDPKSSLGPADYNARFNQKSRTFEITVERAERYIRFPKNHIVSVDALAMLNIRADFLSSLSEANDSLKWTAFTKKYATELTHVVTYPKDTHKIHSIVFHNVWNRENLIINSSLADISYNRYIGFTNSVYSPVKLFKMSNEDQTFWIDLVDNGGEPVELTSDLRDILLLEAVLYA